VPLVPGFCFYQGFRLDDKTSYLSFPAGKVMSSLGKGVSVK
jgi:hypothetical protein